MEKQKRRKIDTVQIHRNYCECPSSNRFGKKLQILDPGRVNMYRY